MTYESFLVQLDRKKTAAQGQHSLTQTFRRAVTVSAESAPSLGNTKVDVRFDLLSTGLKSHQGLRSPLGFILRAWFSKR